MEPAAVVRGVWDAYLAGDVEGALRYFAPNAVWHTAGDFAGPATIKGHEELRVLLDPGDRFSMRRVTVTGIADMGAFVLAHGAVYAEVDGTPAIDRVTIWRFYVEGDLITSVHAEVPDG